MSSSAKKIVVPFVALALIVFTALPSQADTVTLGSSADANIASGDANQGSYNYCTVSPAGKRSLFKFDLSSIPAGQKIDSAILKLGYQNLDTDGETLDTINVFRVTKNWTEGGVVWDKYDGVNWWANLGGDAVGTTGVQLANPYYSGQFPMHPDGGINGKAIFDVTNLVAEWYAGTYSNYGMLLANPNTYYKWHVFASKEHSTVSRRPILEVTYSEIPEPGTLALLAAGLAGLLCYAWRRRR